MLGRRADPARGRVGCPQVDEPQIDPPAIALQIGLAQLVSEPAAILGDGRRPDPAHRRDIGGGQLAREGGGSLSESEQGKAREQQLFHGIATSPPAGPPASGEEPKAPVR